MECTTGTEPAILRILRDTSQLAVSGPLLQRFGNGSRQNTGHLQADTLVSTQVHTAAIQEGTVLLYLDAGNRCVAHINSIITAEHIAGLRIKLLVVKIVLTKDLSRSVFAFEMDDKPRQRLGSHIFKSQANRNFASDITFQQFHPDKLNRASCRVIIGAGLRHEREILIHDPTPTFYSWASGRSVSGSAAVSAFVSFSCATVWPGAA